MSETWVERVIASLATDEQKERADLRRAQLAESGAAHFFESLVLCVQDNVSKLLLARPWLGLNFQRVPSTRFLVSRFEFPAATLEVERDGVRLRICHSFRPDGTGDRSMEESDGLLVADLQGNMLGRYRSHSFADVSDLSQALLMPMLNFLIRNR